MLATPETYQFGRFKLDPARRALLVDGLPIPINARSFDILELLIRCRDRVLTREEIVAHVWQGLAVGDNNLTVQMSTLRRLLADHAGADQLIVTLPGRGYQFVGELTRPESTKSELAISPLKLSPPLDALPPANVTSRPHSPTTKSASPLITRKYYRPVWVAVVLATFLVSFWALAPWRSAIRPAPRLSIAVLPFRNLSADRSQDYLADAVSDDLTTDLAHIPASVVIARESADTYKDRAVAAVQIGQELNVRYLIEGSIRAEPTTLHVNAQLIETASGVHLWAEHFDVPRDHVDEARNAIVRRIANTLNSELATVEADRSLRDRPNDPDSLDLFFRARAVLSWDDSLVGFQKAQNLLEASVAREPAFADALAELGWMLLRKVETTDDPNERKDYAEAKAVIERALTISPRSAKALAAKGRVLAIAGRYADAEYAANSALAIEPSSMDAHLVLADCAQARGQLEAAVPHLLSILQLSPRDPLNKPRYLMLGHIRLVEGRTAEAIDLLHRAIAGDPEPTASTESLGRPEFTRLLLIAAYEIAGDSAQALAIYNTYKSIWPNRSTWRIGAYYQKSVAHLPGVVRILAALQSVGMPQFASEYDGSSPSVVVCKEGDFAPTPPELRGGETLSTSHIVTLLHSARPPLVIDVGRGAAAIIGSVHSVPSDDTETSNFVEQVLLARFHSDHQARVIIVWDGPFGCQGYHTAEKLVSDGYNQVAWYRGGEEAWSAAGQPSQDLRTQ